MSRGARPELDERVDPEHGADRDRRDHGAGPDGPARTFEPAIVPKHKRRIAGFDEAMVSLSAKGMTTGCIHPHLSDAYGHDISGNWRRRLPTGSWTTCRSGRGARSRRSIGRSLSSLAGNTGHGTSDSHDGPRPRSRHSPGGNTACGLSLVWVALGIDLDGHRDVRGMGLGPTGGAGSKQWMNMLTELKSRGVQGALFVCCDGLKGLPDSIVATWHMATVPTCVAHVARNSLRFASRKSWMPIADHLKKVSQAPTVKAAEKRFDEFAEDWEPLDSAMIAMWRRSLGEFTPFLDHPLEIR
jgi:putative transposase